MLTFTVNKKYLSEAQRNLFEACLNNPGSVQGKCPPRKVLEEYHAKSRGKMSNKDLPKRKKKSAFLEALLNI